ncbi:MAG: toll/interleukin-1 receptor domain-containing protein [Cyanobacteria bacterium CAN_BIN43]|nr:toll/interleukin-1 receptor domain-containing protein [Cyanobacteria bacterium CAN_BIN43]
MKDFFISYTGSDSPWAEWVAWTLEEAGYSVVFQAWYFRVGGNLVLDMQNAILEANRTIAILSAHYLERPFPQPEWAAAFAQDPTSQTRKLIPVRIEKVKPPGLLRQIVYVDIFNCDETEARQRLLSSVQEGRMKPEQPPQFPGQAVNRQVPQPIPFPGASAPQAPTASQRRRLEQRRQTLESEREIRAEKLGLLRKSWAIETQAAIKFQLQAQVKDEETQLGKLDEELDAIDGLLQ